MDSELEPTITAGHLEFDSEGNLIGVTYVNPKTQQLIISKINPDTGEINYPNNIQGELECDHNGDFIKITYFVTSNNSPNNRELLLEDGYQNNRIQKTLIKCPPIPPGKMRPNCSSQ
ncbi:MAG: hypothetical protein H9534_03830 [Dolichospermum circinale Clear-D4]|nr:hypothetical protein [Dolichospermum circinale Clear-D4]